MQIFIVWEIEKSNKNRKIFDIFDTFEKAEKQLQDLKLTSSALFDYKIEGREVH